MDFKAILEREILPHVEKASRYLGTEVNSVHKDPAQVDLRLALIFPDLYDLGLGNLGLHILYAELNALPWVWCERAYAPGLDLEAELRKRDLPLFALESRDALGDFDGLGITLQSELTYTNILNILDLSGLPLRTKDRGDAHPLVFAGGPAVFNPEPLAPFIDFFVIGDGEGVVVEVAEALRAGRGRSRDERLDLMAAIPGVYVPARYPFEVLPDGRVLPVEGHPKVVKRLLGDLNGATFPTSYIVPFTQQVHDRVSLEVLRGCTQGCRFCQAGMTTRPVRERKIEKIDELMRRTLENTGYEEVSLVSLSTCDYSQVQKMVNQAVEIGLENRVGVSLPSLRLDSFSVGLADLVAETRRSGITFAPEAATPRMRAVINKFIPDEELLEMSATAFGLGWKQIKLYFMIGLPTERDEDIEAIADLAIRTLEQGRRINPKARVNLGVSTFVPKPFTPFQWAAQIGVEETNRRQDLLMEKLRPWSGTIKFGRHYPWETFIEGLISRSDRRSADLIEAAWRRGARFDAWTEHLSIQAWTEAIEEVGYDVAHALRERDLDERLPWDHIDVMVDKAWLREDWERAVALKWAPDCRRRICHQCGVIDRERDLCTSMLKDNRLGAKAEKKFTKPLRAQHVEPPSVQRLWFRYARTGNARFLSHLEAVSAWLRTMRRARAPLSWSAGFHPLPKVAFSWALPAGQETTGDYMDVTLHTRVDPATLMEQIRATVPEGFELLGVQEVPLKAPSLMSLAQAVSYTLFFPEESKLTLARRVAELRQAEHIMLGRTRKKGKRRVPYQLDIKPMICDLAVASSHAPAVDVTLATIGGKPGKASELVELLTDRTEGVRVLRKETWARLDDGSLVQIDRLGPHLAALMGRELPEIEDPDAEALELADPA